MCKMLNDLDVDVIHLEYTGEVLGGYIGFVRKVASKLGIGWLFAIVDIISNALNYEEPQGIIIGGGQILLPGGKFIYCAFAWMVVAKMLNCKYHLFSVGTEPGINGFTKIESMLLKLCINNAESVHLRDKVSRNTVYQICGVKCEIVPDAVYGALNRETESSGKKNVFICPGRFDKYRRKYGHYKSYEGFISDVMRYLNNGVSSVDNIVLFSTNVKDKDDVRVLKRHIKSSIPDRNVGVNFPSDSLGFVNMLSSAQHVITSRMHPGIVGHIKGVKVDVLAVSDKIRAFRDNVLSRDPSVLGEEVRNKIAKLI